MQEVEDEPLFAERVAGIDIAKAEVEVTIRVPSDTRRGPPAAGDPLVPHHPQGAAGAGGLAALLGGHQGRAWRPPATTGSRCTSCWKREGFDCELYHAAQVKALPGRPKTDRARLGLAGADHRAGRAALQLRAARADPPAAHPHPLPAAPDPGPHRREAAGGEAARGRAPEAVQS